MNFYAVEIRNNIANDQEFIIEAESLIDAHMKGLDFAKRLDEKILEKFPEQNDCNSEVALVGKWKFTTANDEGIDEYLESNKDYFGAFYVDE
jgi:hypothetical protein